MSRTCAYALALPVGATTHECLSHCVEALGRQRREERGRTIPLADMQLFATIERA
jgi:hypothetical protein